MIRRRTARVLVALGLAMGLTTSFAAVAAAQSAVTTKQAENGFKGLKRVKEPTSCPNEPGITSSEIKIGSIIPTSGPAAASFSASREGLDARLDKANTEGELGNRKLTVVNVDDAGDAAKNTTAAQQLVENERVFAVISNTNAADASAKYLYDQGVPVVGWHLGLPAFGTYPNFFGWKNSSPKDGISSFTTRTIDFMKDKGAKKVALVGQSQANSARVILQSEDAVKRTKGIETVFRTVDIPTGSTEFGTVAQQIKDAGADALYTGMDFAANIGLMNALKQAGADVKVAIFPGGYDPRVTGNPAMDGVYFGLEFKPFELQTPGHQEFDKWLPEDVVRGQVAMVGWLMGEALIEGLKQAGVNCPTRKAFIANLRLVDDYTANGWFDPIDYREEFDRPFPCGYYVQVQNQAFAPEDGGDPYCAAKVIRNKKLDRELSNLPAPPATTTPPG